MGTKLKYIKKIFEEAREHEISDDLIVERLDQMIDYYMKNDSFSDIIENIENFYDEGSNNSRYYYHVESWKEIIEEIVKNRLEELIIKAVQDEPQLYPKYSKFIEEFVSQDITEFVPEHIMRSSKTGLWDMKGGEK